jgi:chromosome segregation ATPase
LGQEARQKEDLIEIKIRQRAQQLQAEFDARQAELQTQTQHFHRRREEESADASERALREQEAHLRQEMQQKVEAALAKAKQREQELLAELRAQTESHKQTQHQWETEFTILRRNIEPLNELLKRTELERDEAKQSATEHFLKVQDMEKKLTEASSVLTGWKNGNGKNSDSARVGRDILQVAHIGSRTSDEQ